jgi:hypothetical protein
MSPAVDTTRTHGYSCLGGTKIMSHSINPFPSFGTAVRAASALALLLAGAGEGRAQTYDHLQCFKIRDEKTFRDAAVDLDSVLTQFGLQSCTIKGGAKKLCVPADKAVTSITDGAVIAATSEELGALRLCYKLRCPTTTVPGMTVSDQFGSRSVGSFKAVELCTPANQGPPPTTSTTSTTTTTDTTSTTLPDLDDTFDGVTLDPSWTVLNPAKASIGVSGGSLHMEPLATGGPNMWFDSGEGALVYKLVSGDFDVSAVMATRDPANHANPPPPEYRLAGILARDPASTPASSNTVHVAIGAGSNVQGTSYEYKSTDDSVSTWATTPTASPAGQVRLRRSGTLVEMYWRPDSISSWTMIQSFVRADLPPTLQVGLMVYALTAPASIEALFDEIDFQ